MKQWFVASSVALWACLSAAEVSAEDGRSLVRKLLAPETTLEELPGVIDRLVELAPVTELEGALDPDAIGLTGAERIATVLARIDTPASRAVLRKMLFTSSYLASDVLNWAKLAAQLASGEPGGANPAERALWQTLPRYARDAVKGTQGTGGEFPKRIQRGIVAGLNQALQKEDLYKLLRQEAGRLGEEAKELLQRHERSGGRLAPGKGLALIELERLNRRLLDIRFAGSVKPLDSYDIHEFNPRLINASHAALWLLRSEEGRELRLSYRPIGFREKLTHIENLKGEDDPSVVEALAELLLDEEIAISKRAKDEILRRLREEPEAVKDAMEGLAAQLRSLRVEPQNLRSVSNALEVYVSIPDPRASATLFAELLSTDNEDLIGAALDVISKKPALAGEKELFEALRQLATRAGDADVPIQILKIMMNGRITEGVWIAKDLLEHSDLAVKELAVRFLRLFSGENRGSTPEAWADYVPAPPPAAMEEATPRPVLPPPKEPTKTKGAAAVEETDFRPYTVGAAGAGAILLLLAARHLVNRRKAQKLDAQRRRFRGSLEG